MKSQIRKSSLNRRVVLRISLVFALLLSMVALVVAPANANHPGPVTLSITRVTNLGDTGIESNLRGPADMYAFVVIDGQTFDNKLGHKDDDDDLVPGFLGIPPGDPDSADPPTSAFVFSAALAAGRPDSVAVRIEIWDHDDCDPPRCSIDLDPLGGSDDQGDVDPTGDNALDLVFDRNAGTFTGDVSSPAGCAEGTGDSAVRVCFDISSASTSGDADGDGLQDGWELNGFDADGGGPLPNVDLPGFGADPLHKDLFLELDYETGQSPNRAGVQGRAEVQAMKAAFRGAPLTNPDGVNGVNLWVDTGTLVDTSARKVQAAGTCTDGVGNGGGDAVDGADPDCFFLDASVEDPLAGDCNAVADINDPNCLVGDNFGGGTPVTITGSCNLDAAFYAAKAINFNAGRAPIFRYAVSLNLEPNPPCPPSGGWGEIGGNDFMDFNHDGGTIMHELGHTLNLQHGGNDGNNCEPNYVSGMNYDNQFNINRAGGGSILDFSPPRDSLNGTDRGVVPAINLVENALNDGVVLDGSDTNNRYVFADSTGTKVQFPLNQGANWNSDTDPPGEPNQTVNLDTNATGGGPSGCANAATNSTLTPFNDWNAISLPFRQFGDSANGAINPEDTPSPTLAELLEMEADQNTTDLTVSITDTPDPVVAGTVLTYNFTVTNNGPNPATGVQVKVPLPADLTFAGGAGCAVAASVVTCNVGEVLAKASKNGSFTVNVGSNVVHANGGPKTVTVTATVSNTAGPDSNNTNDTGTTSTLVIAKANLQITKTVTSAGAAGFNYKLTVKNNGPSTASNVVVTDDLAPGMTAGPVTKSDPSFTCVDPPGSVDVRCTSPSLAAGATATFTYSANLPENATPGASFPNSAAVSSSTEDPTPANNASQVTAKVPSCQKTGANVIGTSGADVLCGTGSSNDMITGGVGADLIFGLGGDDRITGGDGNDVIFGGPGNDDLTGGAGNDRLFGNDGNDTLTGGSGTDFGSGGPGTDTCTATESGIC